MSQRRKRGRGLAGRIAGAIFSSIFILMGLAFLAPFFLVPVGQVVRARGWVEAACMIERSEVRDHGDTHSVAVAYHYRHQGVRHSGDRPYFMTGSTTGRAGKQAMVQRWAPGTVVPCWIDPRQPDRSVLHRGLTADMWFGLIPGAFVLLGVLALYASLRKGALPGSVELPGTGGLPPEARVGPESRRLQPESTPRFRFLAMLGVAVFWNGVISIFVMHVIDGWRTGENPILVSIFLLPFVAIGLFLLAWALAMLLSLVNPRVTVTLRPGLLVAGERGDVEWELHGRHERIKSLNVTLEGRELTTVHGSGNRRRTHVDVFARVPVGEGRFPGDMRRGGGRLLVPAGARPTSSEGLKEVRWVLKVHGEIERWPDLREEFPVGVVPAAGTPIDG